MKHYQPQPTHIVPAIPVVTKMELLQDRKRAIELQVAAEHRKARSEFRPANVTALSATLRAVKKQIASCKPR